MSIRLAANAGAWSAIDIVFRQGVQFGITIVLARLLAPADFGLIALLTFFTSLSIMFVQGGLSLALVQRQETSHEEESAVFWCNLAASILFAGIIAAIAPLVADFYGHPVLRPLMFVAAAQVVLSALGAVQTALLTRTLRFDQLAKTGAISSIASGVLGIAAAVAGFGVWALAIQILALAAFGTASLWWVSDWRPALRFRLSSLRGLFGFGVYVSLSSILEVLYGHGFALVVGKVYGVRDLGILNRANGIQHLPTSIISNIISRTALPLFSSRASEPEALLRGFKLSVSFAMLVSLPMMTGLILLPELIVETLFGFKWIDAAPLLRIIALGGILLPLHILNLQLLLAQGDSKRFLRLEIQKKLLGVVCLGTGCFFGIEGLCWGGVLFSVLALFINARPTQGSLGFGALAQLWGLRDIVAATAVMAAIVLLARPFIDFVPALSLIVLATLGAVAYVGTGLLLRLPSFRDALTTAKLLRPGGGAAAATAPAA